MDKSLQELGNWIQERLENCERIAGQKTGADKQGWLDDAEHFKQVLSLLAKAADPGFMNNLPAEKQQP